jgi:hypothetical protein
MAGLVQKAGQRLCHMIGEGVHLIDSMTVSLSERSLS